jgi:hypothetical protein
MITNKKVPSSAVKRTLVVWPMVSHFADCVWRTNGVRVRGIFVQFTAERSLYRPSCKYWHPHYEYVVKQAEQYQMPGRYFYNAA